MKKKFVRLISAVLSAAMTLTAVPLSAFAEGEGHTHDGESNVITTPLDFREKTADENGVGWSWDHDTKTLTLNGVNIQATTEENMMSVVTVPDGTEIVLNGNNTIVQTDTGKSDTYVLSAVNNKEVNCDGTMTISGDGVLNAENRSTDSMARSLGGSIILNGGTVNATGTVKTNSLEIHNDGVLNANATTASFEGVAVNVSRGITVDGNGSLTAVGCANESTLNSAILLTSNFGDKISVSENGSITVPEGNAARVGIYYSGNNGDGMDAEISGGKVTAYGAKYGIYKVNLIMSGTGSVYTTGGSYAIGQTVPAIDEDEFVVKGSTESKASESAVTGEVKLNGGYYEIDGADAKTVVIKPDTSPRIILGKQTGIFKTEEYEIIEGETDTKLKGTVYFDITLKNMSDEEFADARGNFGGDEPDLSASIIKTDYGWVCMVCDTEFSVTYDTDNTLTIKCGDIVSNTVQVKSNANRFNKVTQGDNTNRTVFYTNTSQEEKDNYKLISTYTVDSESISYNWYSTNSAYSADELGAAVSGSNGEFKLADNIPAGNYVLYCDITYSDGDSTETVTEKFTFTYKECAHENGYSDGKCTNCGALCDHSNVDIDTGKCNKCEHQFVATISTDGSAPTGYDTLADCLDSITADTGNYVKIYQDIGDTSATATLDTIDVNHNVMIDLNGHKLNNIKLGVNKDVKLALTGTAGSYVTQVYVRKGGSFIIDSAANVEFDTIFVEAGAGLAVNDGAKVTTASLTVKASVNDDGTTTTAVKLATGMKIGGLTYWRQDGSGLLKLGNLLDVTRQALQYDESGEYHDLYKEFVSKDLPVALTVVEHTDADHKYGSGTGRCEKCGKPCEHGGDINTDNGICSICGAVVSVALYTDGDGNLSSYLDADELHSLLNEYNGSGTIKLFKDYSKPSAQYDLYGELTIDVNGRQFNIRSITPCKNGKLTIKNSGNPVMLGCNVYPTNDASYAGGTLIIDGDVVLDTAIYVYDSSTVILKAGTYPAGLYARDSKTLYDMLGEGKAFFKTDGTLFNASVKEISSSVTLIVKDHSHTYVDGKCECGYVCPHSDVDSKTGKCNECEYQYAAVIVKDGAVAFVYKETEMGAAFEAADSEANTGCTLRVYKNYTGSYTTLSGKFTLWIAEKANVGTLTVSGDITVTGSIKNNRIYGDFNVAAGGKLTFDEKCGAVGTVSVGAGTFDCYSTFAITLNINDASSDVILHGGAFKTICYNGGGDRANAEILTLLAENRMFMKSPNPESIDGSKTLLKDGFATTVIVIPHEDHSYDSTTGKCTICGKRCGHTDVDSKTGVCLTCEYQLTAGVSGVGTAKYFDNIDDAFTAALSEVNSGCTLTLYQDCELSQNAEIGNATVTVDINGHSISLRYRIKVNDGGVLYLKNSGENGSIETEIDVNKGGTLINGTADDSRSAVSVFGVTADAAKRVEIYGGSYEGLTVNNGTSGIALYGGSYELINTNDLTDSTPVSALLAKGYAFATLNSVTHLPESIVDGSAVTLSEGIRKVTVVKHTHTYTETNTKCACGAVLYAKVTSADGTTNEYFDSIEEGLLYADKAENKGCVFTLVTSGKIKDEVTLSSGQFTITANNYGTIDKNSGGRINIDGADVIAEGHMLINCGIDIYVNSGSLTLPEGSSTRFDTILILGGNVNISEGVNADNNAGADNLIIANDATDAKVTIGGGTYGRIVFGQLKLKDVLASGARVIRYDNSSDSTAEPTATALLYSEIAEESSLAYSDGRYYLFTKCDHKNEDGSYAFNEGGICKYCNSEFAASVSYTVDGSAKTELFGDIYDAFDKANEIGTATVTLYKDITDSKRTQEITVMGNVTLELNGKTLGGRYSIARISVSDGGTLTVNGDGDMDTPIYVNENSKLVINGGGYFNSVSVKKGGNAEIGGGTIQGLSVRGNVKLSGGKFNDIEIFNGNLESVLADGYAYKNADGTWLSIDEREKDSYLGGSKGALSVEKAPIKSASIAWDGGGTPVIYRNGAKKLKVNVTCDVADTSKRITYSDFVNGNNRSKDSKLSVNWYMVFGYKIGEIVAEDGEVEYYTVLKCDGYEYKSNVLKFTLATCSHPEDSFNNETDGLVFCGICDLLIEAEVVDADGKSLGYAGLNRAIKLAQENEGSTVKLISERVPASITVTGGKFTVDFNGKEAYYQFTVNGGDVTFTSSAVQDVSNQNLPSRITVNGTDAEVTIDGKIKLGSVTLTSGTLRINSTDGYIKELSINGGKAVIDDAIIGELKTNSGDTVINCVEADSLSVNINGSGSISIVTGEFGSTTCKTGLGMAIASGSIVCINSFTIYTYDAIQTMTKTDRIFVEKCVHKDGSGSYELDGNPCPYCNEEIVATVSYTANGGEETDLFSDIYDAFDKANEIGTATVTLQKNITDDITDTIAVTGNVTLELNGKRLSQPGTDVWYSIEVTSGKLTVNGSGLIKRVAVRNDGDAEINDGTFSDFIIKDGGNAVIKGGQFYSLQVSGEGRNVGQLLADGYAYWSFIDSGIWSTIAEREKQDIANVEVKEAPIKSASIAWYGGGTPVIYRNGAKNLDVNVTYELADASKQITYSDYVNGNNHSKDSEFSDNWYTVFGYKIGEIVAEDGEVEYYTVLKCNGYEYKSNVLKLTLATCSHPEDSFTEKNNDGGVFCGICGLRMDAQVIKADGEPLGYADIESAIKLAQENEGSTVKLISEGVSTSNISITVTGGKFTVDFNGKEVYYNSDVKGGDVTFTSSVKQADAENLLSTINVNGADAKVTIDGKIKLGRVRTFSGTLTVNSTDGYIDELSTEGGKTVIDGARIGALRTFGGEAVINDVNADSLAMFDNRSGESEYNISIVSGRFGSFTCNADSGYTIGKVMASGSSVFEEGEPCYYDSVKNRTEGTDLVFGVCDHKNNMGRPNLNDANVCNYCNEEIVATVSYTANGGEETDLFSDICDAFDKANEIGTATITLCRDIADSEIAHEINVTGNVTLALNGKTLGATNKANKIYICGSTLTVNGNGKVWSTIEAKPDSKLTITNGEYNDVYALSDSEVVILDGIIDCLSVYGTGKAEVSGGKFKYLFMYNGKAIESVLADGYAYKNADGTWLSIDEREKDSYLGGSIGALSVEEAPIKSASISWAGGEAPVIYRNGKKAVTFAADVTYSGDKTLYITGCLIDGTVISEKTELLNGYCSLFSSEVDKAVAEDGEIQYYCIFTYDGYDYKSNAVTLTVATCQHPVESVKCDDNGCVCGICNRALTASVELSDGTLSYYENWNDAIGAAQESEGCTLKLLNYSLVNNNETFDISKGRFTVDLNKNDGNTAFAFDVKGGDITFTASQAASSAFTGVTVSGENANVLIDSKATLNYLVVNSGKVSADGANIGAITINGGDTVINDVNADYLSMKADTTGGSGYNVSIVSGTFNIFTCENESNYTLGRAIASGSRVIGLNAIVGSGFKYAEIQSMTKANYLNVIKCDHKDENDSYALDGNLCPYCNEEIAATVSYTADGGEQTDLFSDIYDAFDKANEAGTATVTLYKDITNSELTQGVTITGNVTLALNGKKLGGTFAFNAPVEVSDGGMFTVGGDGKMRMPIKAYANSKLIINGGEFTSVMVYIDGDAEIGGGVIDALTIIGNAKAKISGGKFYNIEIANGSLESVLADGYAYKKDGGAWLSIAERAESVYSSVNNDNKPVNVEEAPIKSATLSTEINKLYRNSNANPTLKFNLALAHGSNLNDSYVSKRYGINSYVSGDIIYSSLSALVTDAKLSADEIIDKAGDSDAAEIYFVVTTGDGYEIKSNTVSIDLVDCDHSQVVDPTADKETAGNITTPTYCEICESKFNAKITKGDDVKYYNDLDEAAKDAQKSENEGCTLYPLYNKNGYGGQLVITEGNFTLKYAVRTAFSRPIIINGKAKLTVTGRCAVTAFENQDAFIVRGGDVTFDGLATGSNVTINGGNVTMASNNINCLTINGGNVSISSGGFAEIVTTVSDKVIADYIDHGFWVQDRGTKEWIDIYSLNKATASSTNGLTVRVCPMQIIQPRNNVYYTNGYYPDGIPSLQISAVPWYSGEVDADVAYQWIGIDENGNETEIEGATDRKLSLENLTTGRYYCRITYSNATTAGVSMKSDVVTATITECEHSGGEATCTNKAKCEICGAEYGKTKPHSYAHIKSPEYLKSAATCTAKAVYYTSCTECGRSSKGTADEATFEYGNALGHKYGEWVSNGDGTHTRVCANDNKHTETKACHGGKATCTAKAICEVCGKAYGEMKPHSYTHKKSPEYLKSAATCTAKAVYYTSCADCGLSSKGTKNESTFEYGNALGHKYGKWVSNGDGTHTRVCANDSTHIETKNCHGGKATCTAKAICEVCGKAYGEMTAHTFTAKSTVSRYLKKAATCTEKSEYYVSCAGCGLSSKGTKSEATFEGSALGHLLTQWNVTDASCTESGSEERHCTRCDYKQTQIIPAKGHTFGEWKITKNVGCVTDGEQTRECTVCGSKETKVIAATGVHVYGGWKVTKAPTCTTAGVKERTCAGCNAKETMTLQATGHKYTTSTVKPTYSAKGYTLYKCSLCGKSYKSNYTNMLVLPSVSGLKATSRTDKSITLGWNRNANATGYVIEYYNGAKWVKKSTVTKNTTVKYTVSSLKPGTVNKFRIRAYKATNYSAYSYITVNTLPSAVSGFKTVSKTSSTSTLSWNKNTSADGYIIERYIVNRWVQTQKVVGSGNVSATIKSLTAGSTNKLRIRAYKTINKKTEYSSYTYLNVKTKPAQMTGLKAKSKTNNTVTLQWNKNATADSVFIEKYDGSKWVNVKKLSAGFTTYTVNGLSSGRTYRFRVRAYRAGEYSGYTYLNVNTRPYTTTGMKSKSVTKNSIVLQWNKNTSADGYSIEKYDGKKWVQVKRYTSNKSTTYTIKGLKARTTYKFRMRAYKTIGKVNEYSAYTYCNVTTAK